jgi:hypothetical protein
MERESLTERNSFIDQQIALRYLSPVKSLDEITTIYKFVNEHLVNEDSEAWKVFFNPAVLKRLKVNEDLFDESETCQNIKKILIQKLIIKTIYKNFKEYYDKYEKEQKKQERLTQIRIVLLHIYFIFFVIASIMYSVNTIYNELEVMSNLLKNK